MVQLAEGSRLPPVVDRDDARAGQNVGRELLLAGLVRANGGDVRARVEPSGLQERERSPAWS